MIRPIAIGQDIVPVLKLLNDSANWENTYPPVTPNAIAIKIHNVRNRSKNDNPCFCITITFFS